jgi:hypothetical protein
LSLGAKIPEEYGNDAGSAKLGMCSHR